jgi:hypothetical protein
VGDQNCGGAVLEHKSQPRGGLIGIQGDIAGSSDEDSERADDEFRGTGEAQRHEVFAAHSRGAQPAAEFDRPSEKRAIGQCAVGRAHRQRTRILLGDLGDTGNDSGRTTRAGAL